MGRHEAIQADPARLRRPVAVAFGGGAAIAATALAVTLGGLGDDDGSTSSSPRRQQPALSAAPPSSSSAPPTSPTSGTSGTSGTATMAMAMGPTLQLRAVGTSWVEVRGPRDQVLVSRTFHRGDTASFNQARVHVTIGNGAAIRMTANGMPVKPGRPGQVELMSVVRGGD